MATARDLAATDAMLLIFVIVAVCVMWKRIKSELLWHIQDGLDQQAWERLPMRIILLRHGQAEHNLEGAAILTEENPDRKPDNLSELTELGREQALESGALIRDLLGDRGTISVVVSPFERTLQTLYSLQRALGNVRVRKVHVDPRVREQEFGNFQKADEMRKHSQTSQEVGRFYYRRPTGESGADVYDRASNFWESLLGGALTPQEALVHNHRTPPDDALLVVTHGLTMRLLLMRYFAWSPQTFDAVYNPGNCDFWVLAKDPTGARRYCLEPSSCSPPRMPWATRQVRVVDVDGAATEHTLVDYLSLPQPRKSMANGRRVSRVSNAGLSPRAASASPAAAPGGDALREQLEAEQSELRRKRMEREARRLRRQLELAEATQGLPDEPVTPPVTLKTRGRQMSGSI